MAADEAERRWLAADDTVGAANDEAASSNEDSNDAVGRSDKIVSSLSGPRSTSTAHSNDAAIGEVQHEQKIVQPHGEFFAARCQAFFS